MTFVVELRDSKKSLPGPLPRFWQRAGSGLCALRVRLAILGLLGVAFECPLDHDLTPNSSVLALLCGVLTAAVSATLGLLRDTGIELAALFNDPSSPVFQVGQRLSLCLGEPMLPFDICPEAGSFPALSRNCLFALLACALLLFGCGFNRQERPKTAGPR